MKLSKELNFICFILVFCFVNSQQYHQQQNQQSHQQRHHARRTQQQVRTRRIYAMCPPSFTKIGNECYHLSDATASWLDSHFECKDKNAKLAEPLKYSDRLLRKYFLERGRTRDNIWIGGMYNWQRHKWQWGYNGKDMTYQSFSQMKPGEDLKYNCAVLNPDLKYRWSAKLCFEKHYYLCQHRMPYVSEKNRQRIYTRWNETFPGQMANEIQVEVPANRRDMQQRKGGGRRASPSPPTKRHQQQQQQQPQRDPRIQLKNQPTAGERRLITNEINPPEVSLRYDTQLRRKKQQKDKSKENRTVILSGNVDLGQNILKNKKLRNRKRPVLKSANSTTSSTTTTTTTSTTTQNPNYQNIHHRHNHYNTVDDNARIEDERLRTSDRYLRTSTMRPTTTTTTTSTTDRTVNTPSTSSTSNYTAAKQMEKRKRYENIREKLARLSDEEKMEYLKIKAQRKAERSKSINETIP